MDAIDAVPVIEPAEPAPAPFAAGDTVRLRLPGAPEMLVEMCSDEDATVVWVDSAGHVHRAGLAVAALEKV